MPDREKVINALEVTRKGYVYKKNGQNVISLDVRFVDMILALLKEQEAVSSEALKAHYGKMYKCKGCGLEWYQQTQRYCQHCGKAVRL